MIYSYTTQSPVGAITITADEESITGLRFGTGGTTEPNGVILNALRQLDEYFSGSRKCFDLPLKPHGTPFQRSV